MNDIKKINKENWPIQSKITMSVCHVLCVYAIAENLLPGGLETFG